MTTTPTPAPEVEALIERASHSIARIATVQNSPVQVWQAHVLAVNDLAAALRSQAARIKELEAERDDVENELDQVARHLNGALEEADRAEFERDRLASRVERLRGALEPLLRTNPSPTARDFEAARAALEETEE